MLPGCRGRPWTTGTRRWVTRTTATTALTAAIDGWSDGYCADGGVAPPPSRREREALLQVLAGSGCGSRDAAGRPQVYFGMDEGPSEEAGRAALL